MVVEQSSNQKTANTQFKMFYIVPSTDQTADGFVIRRDGVTEEYKMPLTENTVTKLRGLAKWLNIKSMGRAAIPELVSAIETHLTLVPLEIAVAAHPILGTSVPATSAACASRVAALVLLQRQNPAIRVHAGWAIEQAEAAMRTLVAEEQRAATAAERARWAAPAWLAEATEEAPAGPYYKISIRSGEQEHDGYCTGTEEEDLYVSVWEERTVYLSVGEFGPADLNAKASWSEGGGDEHCCCGAARIVELTGWERVE